MGMPDEILCAIAGWVERTRDMRALGAACRTTRGAMIDAMTRRWRRNEANARSAMDAFVDEWQCFSRKHDDANWGQHRCLGYWIDDAKDKGILPKQPECTHPGDEQWPTPHDDDAGESNHADWSIDSGLPGSSHSFYVCDKCADMAARAFDDPLHTKWPMVRVDLDAPHVWTATWVGCEPRNYMATPKIVGLRVPNGLAEWIDADAADHLYGDIITARRLFDTFFRLPPPHSPQASFSDERSGRFSGDSDGDNGSGDGGIEGDHGIASDGDNADRENPYDDLSDDNVYCGSDDDPRSPCGHWDSPPTDTDDSVSDEDATWAYVGTWATKPRATPGDNSHEDDGDGDGSDRAGDNDGRPPPDHSGPLRGDGNANICRPNDDGTDDDDDDYVGASISRLYSDTPSSGDGNAALPHDTGPHVVVLDERAGAPRQDPFRCFNHDRIHSRLPRYCLKSLAPAALVRIEQIPIFLMGNPRAWLPIGRHSVQRHRESIGRISRYVLVCCDPSSPMWGAAVAVRATTYQWPCIVWIPAADDIAAAIAAFRQRYVGPPEGLRSALVRWLCTARRVPGPRAWHRRFEEAVDRGEPVAPLWTGFPRFRRGPRPPAP